MRWTIARKALELDALLTHAWTRKALAHAGRNEFELAFDCFRRAAEINPNHPELKESCAC